MPADLSEMISIWSATDLDEIIRDVQRRVRDLSQEHQDPLLVGGFACGAVSLSLLLAQGLVAVCRKVGALLMAVILVLTG